MTVFAVVCTHLILNTTSILYAFQSMEEALEAIEESHLNDGFHTLKVEEITVLLPIGKEIKF